MEENQPLTDPMTPEQKRVGSRNFLVAMIGLIALIIVTVALFVGYLYGVNLQEEETEPINQLPMVVEDPVNDDYTEERPVYDLPDDDDGTPIDPTDNSRQKYEGELTCINPYSLFEASEMEEDTFSVSFDLFPYEDVKDYSYGCGYKIGTDTYSLNVEVAYESTGYLISSEEQMPDIENVDAPLLDVKYLESSTDTNLKRLTDTSIPNKYHYTSYFEVGEENCSQWTSVDEIFGCGVSGISLEDVVLEVSCIANDEDVVYCDQILETVKLEKI